MKSWDKLYPEISHFGQIFSYNRHGVGNTSKAKCDQTGNEVIHTLEKILKALELSPPYILVAHSFGGIFANLYARQKPNDIAAILFLEAAHPEERTRQAVYEPPLLVRAINNAIKILERLFDRYRYSEDDCLAETLREITLAGNFPSIPVTVLTGCKKMPFVPRQSFDIHLQCQKELAQLSSDSIQVIAQQSGHFPQITEPVCVNAALKELVVRASGLPI